MWKKSKTDNSHDTDRPFTPDTLAKRWGCSGKHVRNLIDRGELRFFRLGSKLIRIPADAVREFEGQATAAKQDAPVEHEEAPQADPPVERNRLSPLTRARLKGRIRRSRENGQN
ncbi:excisionase family DNA-binding protein [Maritalea sp. S77]|uniref:excisionase family DNA-binding protein n=1 Tax=Maritalea sp. S77 TaxID=3415125 RepID=UPI003C7E6347